MIAAKCRHDKFTLFSSSSFFYFFYCLQPADQAAGKGRANANARIWRDYDKLPEVLRKHADAVLSTIFIAANDDSYRIDK